jgi:hypothetical protein
MSARSRKTVCLQNGSPPGGRRWLWLVVGASGVLAAHGASADPQVILPQGLPVQVKPTFTEPGLPQFTFPTSGGALLGGSADTGGGNGSGDGSTSAGGGSTAGSGDAYNTMMAQSWGSSAATAAGAMGISATALAATCVMESNCQNVGVAGSTSTAAGAFQMINTTYNADINGAVAYDPSIAGTIVSGSAGEMDPATEAYAASYELRQDALQLENAGVNDPTVEDVRAIYQFGSKNGVQVAQASDSDNLESYINLTPAQLSANGLSASTTVGQWRQTIANKIGSAATQSVLSQ